MPPPGPRPAGLFSHYLTLCQYLLLLPEFLKASSSNPTTPAPAPNVAVSSKPGAPSSSCRFTLAAKLRTACVAPMPANLHRPEPQPRSRLRMHRNRRRGRPPARSWSPRPTRARTHPWSPRCIFARQLPDLATFQPHRAENDSFLAAPIHAGRQPEPGGPIPNPDHTIIAMIDNLSHIDFPTTGVRLAPDGRP